MAPTSLVILAFQLGCVPGINELGNDWLFTENEGHTTPCILVEALSIPLTGAHRVNSRGSWARVLFDASDGTAVERDTMEAVFEWR